MQEEGENPWNFLLGAPKMGMEKLFPTFPGLEHPWWTLALLLSLSIFEFSRNILSLGMFRGARECWQSPVGLFPAHPKFPPPFFWDSLKNWSIWGFFLALKGFLGSKSHKNLRNVGFGVPGTERNSWTLVGIWSAGISWERSGKKKGKMGSGNI